MLFSFAAPFWDCPPLFSFFPSFFFPLFFPSNVGSSPGAGRGLRLPLSFSPPLARGPASLVYIPLPIFGDLKVPPTALPTHPTPPHLCGVQTLSPPLQ